MQHAKARLPVVTDQGSQYLAIFAWLGLDIDDVNRLNFSVDILPSSLSVLAINKWKEHAIFRLNDLS
ncbi:MAG: hypothetical protein ABS956_20485, partial [Pseudomonas sp.]|uniref:hypothetical protein n=1 Tax=Pseudomonas sp. TaxID=306 RepID=UPI003315399E